ncbi:hypothetical protein CCY99_05895 [Helicobacter sp. 16-1353]|uniref:N-6 DNA methylase n=1 Tax=Helicobacter sp. 16-1353 TaxID=2004996 RepID=UPI000DCDFF34|nr:N-6 DNA methylase [Helicobacter sp. 16-1353]RAX53122.1 hypothetical protein CCY99_05895 [Helicobacter sp. 16-1353]
MQKMLVVFDYLKRYHSDIFDVVCILLEIITLKRYANKKIEELLDKAKKRKPIVDDFNAVMTNLFGDLYVKPNANINLIKVLREIDKANVTNEQIELLINAITQKRTINKLYTYSTPMEISRLIVGILDIKNNDEIYNPCYGIGSLFLALARTNKKFKIYGEELDSSLDKITRLLLRTLNIPTNNLFVNNILKNQIFPPEREFNKIMCNPPIDAYIGTLDLKNNERFAKYGFITKSTPELSFIINGISYLKDKGVFVIRNQLLKKTSVEEKFKEKICKNGLLEAIIELPKNIFPHNSADFSLMVISKNNNSVLHIDASQFYKKEGKYNRLVRTDEILELLKKRKDTEYSKLTKLKNINIDDLRVQPYLKKKHSNHSMMTIKSIGVEIIRGQRICTPKTNATKPYLNIGIINFNECGFIDESNIEQNIADVDKIEACKLKPYDILLSLRGIAPKLTMVNKSKIDMVANAGILILRAKNKEDALGLFCFLFSKNTQKILSELYEQTETRTIDINDLYNIELPQDFRENALEKFKQINNIGNKIKNLYKELESLRDS